MEHALETGEVLEPVLAQVQQAYAVGQGVQRKVRRYVREQDLSAMREGTEPCVPLAGRRLRVAIAQVR